MLLSALLLATAATVSAEQPNVFAGGPVNNIQVSVDNVVQCESAKISWSGTQVSRRGRRVGGWWAVRDVLAYCYR